MSEPTPDNVFRAPGLLVASPTGTDPTNSYGGTVLGSVIGVELDVGVDYEEIFYDELGKGGEILAIAGDPLAYVTFRAWDNDALSRIFPSFSSLTGVATLGGDLAKVVSSKGIPLLYAPFDPDAQGFFLLNAVPIIDTSEMGMRFSILRENNLPVVFIGKPASASTLTTGKIGKVAQILA